MKCGNCGEPHETVAKVRECYGDKIKSENATLSSKMSGYLSDLLGYFNLILADGMTPDKIDYQSGRRIMDGLIGARRLKATGKAYDFPDGVLVSPVPKGKREVRTPTRRKSKVPDAPPCETENSE